MLERLAGVPERSAVRDSFANRRAPLPRHRATSTAPPSTSWWYAATRWSTPAPTEADFADYTNWALDVYRRVERAVAAIHARGVVYGDLHLFNIMVRPDGAVALLDFEVAAPADEPTPPALRNQGFAAPRHLTGPDVDRYALACLRLALFAPLTALLRLAPGKAAHLADVIAAHFPVPADFLAEAVATRSAGDAPRRCVPQLIARPRRSGARRGGG